MENIFHVIPIEASVEYRITKRFGEVRRAIHARVHFPFYSRQVSFLKTKTGGDCGKMGPFVDGAASWDAEAAFGVAKVGVRCVEDKAGRLQADSWVWMCRLRSVRSGSLAMSSSAACTPSSTLATQIARVKQIGDRESFLF